jgi:hypothetical protein
MTVSMTQKTAKKKSKKTPKAAANPSVLGSLRSTRPTRLGGERRASATSAAKPSAAKPKAKRAAKPKAKTKRAPAAATQPKATAAHRPTPPPPPPPANGRPGGTEIVVTAVQAAGELAQIGLTVGSQLLKRAAQRIPRP